MKSKSIFSMIIMIALLTILTAGCADTTEEEPTATATPSPVPTLEPTIEPTTEPTDVATPTGEPETYTVRIDSYLLLPAGGREINVGDTLVFRNYETTRLTRVLVSEDGLWDGEQSLKYMKMVSYTFNEPGTYTFYLKGRESKKWIVTVV